MQKWSQENPELLAQAGLAVSAVDAFGGANDHFIAGGINEQRLELLKAAGVDPTKHAHPQSGHPHREPKAKKGKGKGKKNTTPNVHLTVGGVPITIGGHGQQDGDQHTKHKKKNPYMNVDHERLKVVYSQAQKNLVDAVNTAMSSVEAIHTKLPSLARPVFVTAFQSIKVFRMKGASSSTYETSFEKISEALTAYKSLTTNLKYTLRKPHIIPSESIPGTASLLSKLINVTIAFLRTHNKSTDERKNYGMYDLRAQIYNMANAKANYIEINQALTHQKQKHEEFLKNTTRIPLNRSSTNGGAVVRESAEHAFETHGTFSMSNPYET